jgi:hypothetical protein
LVYRRTATIDRQPPSEWLVISSNTIYGRANGGRGWAHRRTATVDRRPPIEWLDISSTFMIALSRCARSTRGEFPHRDAVGTPSRVTRTPRPDRRVRGGTGAA